jgi:hypothetical protein
MPGQRGTSPQEGWAAPALHRAWPGSPPKVPYLAHPATRDAHGLLNNYVRTSVEDLDHDVG